MSFLMSSQKLFFIFFKFLKRMKEENNSLTVMFKIGQIIFGFLVLGWLIGGKLLFINSSLKKNFHKIFIQKINIKASVLAFNNTTLLDTSNSLSSNYCDAATYG